jgi:hypothetical protein
MTTERNRSNAPHPAEYAARQDELKRSLEIIYTTAESARAQDMLGGLAIRLASAVDYVKLPGINSDGIVEEIDGWVQKPTIPVIGLRLGEAVRTPMISITDLQYYGRIKGERSVIHPMGERQIAHYFIDGKNDYNTTELLQLPDKSVAGLTKSMNKPVHVDYHKKDSPIVGAVTGQPNVVIKIRDDGRYENVIIHEVIHAMDKLDEPVECGSLEEARIRAELRAYGVSFWMSVFIAQRLGIDISEDEQYFRSVSMSIDVEQVRSKVNGHIMSPNAFDPNEELIEALDDAGLKSIYS